MALRWRSSFSCNIKEIDNQHKRLFEISSKLNILAPISSKIDFKDEIVEVINELKEYAIYHFDYEEKMMQKFNFEDFEKHRLQHNAFVKRVLELEQEHLKFNRSQTVISIIDFLTGWITAHILKTDMKYKDFFNDIGIY
ncbi:hemerythrin family protein [Clostridium sp. PL3]|uniref:Hemerythrin family protein n=1 Tax=Clostridium thailandense TaxID=2794346 RepID=A0A949X625_9CLOT|nr:bacteriohemerythrin [Clostridium thailandense]MBV7276633.1 hemerythrin family protein [Clostridium thailandense]